MTFQFDRSEGFILGLEEAIGQAMAEARLRGYDPSAEANDDINSALLIEILSQQRQINAAHDEELKTWKTRLNDETAKLRENLEQRRNHIKNVIWGHWGDVVIPEGDVAAIGALDIHIGRLLQERNDFRDKWREADEKLAGLHEFIAQHFPKFANREPTEAATEILKIFATYGPQLIKVVWEKAIQPSLHVLSGMGIDVLPPGVIVFRTATSDKPHKPE